MVLYFKRKKIVFCTKYALSMCKCQVRKLNMLIDKFLKLSTKTLCYPTLWSNNFIPHVLLVKLEYPYVCHREYSWKDNRISFILFMNWVECILVKSANPKDPIFHWLLTGFPSIILKENCGILACMQNTFILYHCSCSNYNTYVKQGK